MDLVRRATIVALLLALGVIMLGAYVRLSDAGLGCPDWPGCYGHAAVTSAAAEPAKAWKEMVHRYFAGTLGLLVFGLAAVSWRRGTRRQRVLFSVASALVVLQAALGMWTVTLRLQPLVVMGHLIGGMSLASLLWLALLEARATTVPRSVRVLAAAALGVVALQIALGGWTSSTYSALACPDFPTCLGQWWPHADFASAFVPWRSAGVGFEHGVLAGPARVAVHVAHRLGAALVLAVVGALGRHVDREPRHVAPARRRRARAAARHADRPRHRQRAVAPALARGRAPQRLCDAARPGRGAPAPRHGPGHAGLALRRRND